MPETPAQTQARIFGGESPGQTEARIFGAAQTTAPTPPSLTASKAYSSTAVKSVRGGGADTTPDRFGVTEEMTRGARRDAKERAKHAREISKLKTISEEMGWSEKAEKPPIKWTGEGAPPKKPEGILEEFYTGLQEWSASELSGGLHEAIGRGIDPEFEELVRYKTADPAKGFGGKLARWAGQAIPGLTKLMGFVMTGGQLGTATGVGASTGTQAALGGFIYGNADRRYRSVLKETGNFKTAKGAGIRSIAFESAIFAIPFEYFGANFTQGLAKGMAARKLGAPAGAHFAKAGRSLAAVPPSAATLVWTQGMIDEWAKYDNGDQTYEQTIANMKQLPMEAIKSGVEMGAFVALFSGAHSIPQMRAIVKNEVRAAERFEPTRRRRDEGVIEDVRKEAAKVDAKEPVQQEGVRESERDKYDRERAEALGLSFAIDETLPMDAGIVMKDGKPVGIRRKPEAFPGAVTHELQHFATDFGKTLPNNEVVPLREAVRTIMQLDSQTGKMLSGATKQQMTMRNRIAGGKINYDYYAGTPLELSRTAMQIWQEGTAKQRDAIRKAAPQFAKQIETVDKSSLVAHDVAAPAPKAKPVGKPQPKGVAQRVVSAAEKAEAAAFKRIKKRDIELAKVHKRGGRAGESQIGALTIDYAIIGASRVVKWAGKKAMTYAEWRRETAKRYDEIRGVGAYVRDHKIIKGRMHDAYLLSKALASMPPETHWTPKVIRQLVSGRDVTPETLPVALRTMRKGMKEGYKAAEEHIVTTHEGLTEYAELIGLSDKARAKVASSIAKARTKGEIRNVAEWIDLTVYKEQHRRAVADYLKMVKQLGKDLGDKWKGYLYDAVDPIQPKKFNPDKVLEALDKLEAKAKDQYGEIPDRYIKQFKELVARLDKPNAFSSIHDLNPQEIRLITDALSRFAKLQKTETRLRASAESRAAQGRVDNAIDTVTAKHRERVKPTAAGDMPAKLPKTKTSFIWSELTRMEARLRHLGSEKLADPIIGIMNRGLSIVSSRKTKAKEFIKAEMKKLDLTSDMMDENVVINTPRASRGNVRVDRLKITRDIAVMLLAHLKDSQTRAKLFRNKQEGILFHNRLNEEPIKLYPEDLKAIIDWGRGRVEDKLATAAAKFVNTKDFRDAPNRATEEVFGMELFKERDPGDYHISRRVEVERGATPEQNKRGWLDAHLEDSGILKSRKGGNAPLVVHPFTMWFEGHTNKVAAIAGKTLPAQEVRMLMADKSLRSTIERSVPNGERHLREIDAWVRDYEGMDYEFRSELGSKMNVLAKLSTVGTLALKPVIMAYQGISSLNLATYHGWKNTFKLSTKETYSKAEIKEYAPMLYERLHTDPHSIITEGARETGMFQRRTKGVVRKSDKFMMAGIKFVDGNVAVKLNWKASKARARADGLTGEAMLKRAGEYALRAIQNTQPSWDVVSTTPMGRRVRKHPGYKMIPGVLFSSQRITNFNQAFMGYERLRYGGATKENLTYATEQIGVAVVANAVAIYAVNEAFWATYYKMVGQDEVRAKKYLADHVTGIVKRMVGNVPVIGDIILSPLVGMVSRLAQGEKITPKQAFEYEVPESLIEGELRGLVSGIGDTWQAIHANADDAAERSPESVERQLGRGLSGLMRGAGAAGIPTPAIEQFARPWLVHPTRSKYYDWTWRAARKGDRDELVQMLTELYKDGARNPNIRSSLKRQGFTEEQRKWIGEAMDAAWEAADIK